ncbi:MAG TPA: V-type ATPase subunit [Mobilitalea sp.]|nr:V-type ATPase subunit [Mobilitalea sp.]
MDSSISYSGINTKVKAMSQKLINKGDLQKISNLEAVADFIAYLKKHPGYHDLFQKYDEREIHRGQAERVFINGLYLDYTKIFRFADDWQRKDLELIFFRYEVNVLKACIRLIHNNDSAYDLSLFHPFFTKHSQIDVNKLSASRSMEEYINNLRGTQYYNMLAKMSSKSGLSSFDYEMALDVYYFTKSWKLKDKILTGNNQKAFTYRLGIEIDLLNIMWIYRSKKMYDMGASDIFTYLIPINYKLSVAQLSKLIGAVTLEEFMHLLSGTKYKDFAAHLKNGTMEQEYARIINKIYLYNMTRYPASMTVVNYYLFRKDREIGILTSALECIRYGLDLKKKQEYLQLQ